MRASNRRVCSSGLTSSQYFTSMMPESTIAFSTAGTSRRSAPPRPRCKNPSRARRRRGCTSCGRRSRPPGGGQMRNIALHVHLRLLALGRRGKRHDAEHAGLTRSVIALIVPPLPAPSRPSKTMQTFAPVLFTHSCIASELAMEAAELTLVFLLLPNASAATSAFSGQIRVLCFLDMWRTRKTFSRRIVARPDVHSARQLGEQAGGGGGPADHSRAGAGRVPRLVSDVSVCEGVEVRRSNAIGRWREP